MFKNFYVEYETDKSVYDVHYYISDKGYCYKEYAIDNMYQGKRRISETEYVTAYESYKNY